MTFSSLYLKPKSILTLLINHKPENFAQNSFCTDDKAEVAKVFFPTGSSARVSLTTQNFEDRSDHSSDIVKQIPQIFSSSFLCFLSHRPRHGRKIISPYLRTEIQL